MIAPRWPCAGLLAAGLVREGCEVHRILDLRGIFVASDPSRRRRCWSWPDSRFKSTVRVDSVFDPAFPELVGRLVEQLQIDVVIPMLEPAMYELWRHPDAAWASRVFPPTNSWQRERVLSKWSMSEAARSWGVDVPLQRRADGTDDADNTDGTDAVREAWAELGLPLVVKDVVGGGGTRVSVCETRDEVTAEVARLIDAEGVPLLQEYVDGLTYIAGGLFQDGRAVRLYTGVKLQQHPARVGPSTLLRSVDEPELTAATLKVFEGLRWTGMASADFVRRPEGGFAFLEVNPRPWGALGAALDAGIDFAGPYAAILRGERPASDLRSPAGREFRLPAARILGHVTRGTAREALAVLSDRSAWDDIAWGDRGEVVDATLHRLRNARQARRAIKPSAAGSSAGTA
jgi:hypothetical protein